MSNTLSPPRPRPAAGTWLVRYGLFLWGVAAAAVLYLPETGQLGFNAAAKTALMSGGLAGGVSILWGALRLRGHAWAQWAGVATTALFAGTFLWRASVGWQATFQGEPHKWYAATLISGMAVASLALVVYLVRQRSASATAR